MYLKNHQKLLKNDVFSKVLLKCIYSDQTVNLRKWNFDNKCLKCWGIHQNGSIINILGPEMNKNTQIEKEQYFLLIRHDFVKLV